MTDAPHHGARFRFDRLTAEDQTADYRVQVLLPGQTVVFRLSFGPDAEGEPQEERREPADSEDVPQWAMKHLLSLARQVARAGRGGGWPRKLVRWHEG